MSQLVWRIPGDGEALNKIIVKDDVIEYGSGPYRTFDGHWTNATAFRKAFPNFRPVAEQGGSH